METTEKILSDIRERVVRVETKIDNIMTDVQDTAEEAKAAKEIASDALASTKSAHRRINKIDKIIFWAGTTIVGAVILALIALVIRMG